MGIVRTIRVKNAAGGNAGLSAGPVAALMGGEHNRSEEVTRK